MTLTKPTTSPLHIDAWLLIALAFFFTCSCTSAPTVPPAARAELAPTGKLRVGLILSNQVLVTKDSGSGELRGVTINLGKALAQRLDVPFEAVGSLYADRLPGARVLEGRYTIIQHAIATTKGKIAATRYVAAFVEEAKVNGTVAEAISAAGLRRTRVAAPSQAE